MWLLWDSVTKCKWVKSVVNCHCCFHSIFCKHKRFPTTELTEQLHLRYLRIECLAKGHLSCRCWVTENSVLFRLATQSSNHGCHGRKLLIPLVLGFGRVLWKMPEWLDGILWPSQIPENPGKSWCFCVCEKVCVHVCQCVAVCIRLVNELLGCIGAQ